MALTRTADSLFTRTSDYALLRAVLIPARRRADGYPVPTAALAKGWAVALERGGLPEVLDALRRRWLVASLVAVPVFAAIAAYANVIPASYDGTAVVAFSPRPERDVGADTMRVVLPKYIAFITARATANRVAPTLNPPEKGGELNSAVDATVAADTANLTIVVRLPTPQRAAAAANAMAAEAVRFSADDKLILGEVVAPALAPSQPAAPRRKLIMAAGLVVAALLGSVVAFLLERGLPRARTPADVASLTGHPVVGRIPPSRVLARNPAEALSDPAVGAAVRTLRTHLERESRHRPVHTLAITSPTAGDGKTTVAAAFAAAVARLDAQVLLIDADLHRPRVAGAFEVEVGARGFAQVLRGGVSIEDAAQKTSVRGLSILPANPDPEAGDLLARRFSEVLREAREHYDVVIVDSPPIAAGDDARTIATLSDAVLLVVAAGAPAGPLSEATAALDSLGVRVLGCVVNRLRERTTRYAQAYLEGRGA